MTRNTKLEIQISGRILIKIYFPKQELKEKCISQNLVFKEFYKKEKYHPDKPTIVQKLEEGDYPRRLQVYN